MSSFVEAAQHHRAHFLASSFLVPIISLGTLPAGAQQSAHRVVLVSAPQSALPDALPIVVVSPTETETPDSKIVGSVLAPSLGVFGGIPDSELGVK
jgi:hypothetical protein